MPYWRRDVNRVDFAALRRHLYQMRWLYLVRCWWRGYHCETPTIGRFRYDVGGHCCYCGKVGDGKNHGDDDDGAL